MAQSKEQSSREVILDMLQTTGKTSASDLLYSYKGILYPRTVCFKGTLEALETVEARDDDVLIVTYPKCGTNWVFQTVCEMENVHKNQQTELQQLLIEFGELHLLEKFKERPSPRIISTHLRCEMIPKSYFKNKAKILLVIRNPKDVAVSKYNFHNSMPALPTYESWNLFFKDFINGNVCYGSYFDYLVEWNKHIDEDNVLVVTFEDMKTDFPVQLKKISEFCRFPLTEEQISEVERRTSFTSMKKTSEETHGKLSKAFFRKGQVGDWKNLFTEEQSKEIDTKFQQYLAGTKLGDLLNYTKYC